MPESVSAGRRLGGGRTSRIAVAAVAAVGLVGVNAFAGKALAGDRAGRAADLTAVPANDAARGLVYDGLTPPRRARAGRDCWRSRAPARSCARTARTRRPPACRCVKRAGAPRRPPPGRRQSLAVCEGDGTSGRRVEVLYIHGSTSRYAQYLETFRTLAEGVDTIFNESAKETGGERHVRYVTETVNGACRPVVRDVQIADSALNANDWAPLLNAVKAAGYTRTDRKYLQFVDSKRVLRHRRLAGDTRKSDANRSNSGPEYARADNGCWTAGVAAHELGHTLGAVNNNAPNASGYGHCIDEWDVMCYKDDADVIMRTVCTDRRHDDRLDCNHDDYYSTNPPRRIVPVAATTTSPTTCSSSRAPGRQPAARQQPRQLGDRVGPTPRRGSRSRRSTTASTRRRRTTP